MSSRRDTQKSNRWGLDTGLKSHSPVPLILIVVDSSLVSKNLLDENLNSIVFSS